MAQTVVVALCIAAAVAAAASVPSASASDQTTAMHLLPVEAAEVLTKGRAGGVAIQKELTGGVQRPEGAARRELGQRCGRGQVRGYRHPEPEGTAGRELGRRCG